MGIPTGCYDGHAHVFHKSLPMTSPRRYTPKENAFLADHIKLMKQHNLDGALLVQPSFLGKDNSYLLSNLDIAKDTTDLAFRGVVSVGPEILLPEMKDMDRRGVVGIRFNLFQIPTPDFQARKWLKLFENVNMLGWHVELLIEGPRLSGLLPYMLKFCQTVVIDHFGLPDESAPMECPGFKSILDAADQNLFVKTSAPFRVFPHHRSTEAATKSTLIYRKLLETLGPEKLVWGSDWPWTMFENRHDFGQTLTWLDSGTTMGQMDGIQA